MKRGALKLDDVDLRILRQLQADNTLTNLALSHRAGVSPPACLRRVRRLRKSGAIVADVSILSPDVAGRFVTCVVAVTLERERLDVVDAFKKSVLAEAAVSQCYFVTGDADFVLIIHVPHLEDYEALTRRLFYANKNIAKFTTMVSLSAVKFSTAVPISVAG